MLINDFIYLLCGQCLKNGTAAIQNNNVDFIKDVINYITENIANSITMKETAAGGGRAAVAVLTNQKLIFRDCLFRDGKL